MEPLKIKVFEDNKNKERLKSDSKALNLLLTFIFLCISVVGFFINKILSFGALGISLFLMCSSIGCKLKGLGALVSKPVYKYELLGKNKIIEYENDKIVMEYNFKEIKGIKKVGSDYLIKKPDGSEGHSLDLVVFGSDEEGSLLEFSPRQITDTGEFLKKFKDSIPGIEIDSSLT